MNQSRHDPHGRMDVLSRRGLQRGCLCCEVSEPQSARIARSGSARTRAHQARTGKKRRVCMQATSKQNTQVNAKIEKKIRGVETTSLAPAVTAWRPRTTSSNWTRRLLCSRPPRDSASTPAPLPFSCLESDHLPARERARFLLELEARTLGAARFHERDLLVVAAAPHARPDLDRLVPEEPDYQDRQHEEHDERPGVVPAARRGPRRLEIFAVRVQHHGRVTEPRAKEALPIFAAAAAVLEEDVPRALDLVAAERVAERPPDVVLVAIVFAGLQMAKLAVGGASRDAVR
mmetsp:Transcript_15499/g.47976  ORF Transcript_15499/g.47976 Transcript_15499/m.47976 type:complete len:289 (-) Transcript_15499:1153-2019(-)